VGVGCVVLRLKRTRNPDLVFLERLEHFLNEMNRDGKTVLLCGVRPELAEAMARLHFQDWLPEGSVFLEEEVLYSSTLKAVRWAYKLMEDNRCAHCRRKERSATEEDALYYLV
jgi:SulP family sulfate permease